jgi:hypothetical protein
MTEHTQDIEQAALKYGASYLMVSTADDFFESFTDLWRLINKD